MCVAQLSAALQTLGVVPIPAVRLPPSPPPRNPDSPLSLHFILRLVSPSITIEDHLPVLPGFGISFVTSEEAFILDTTAQIPRGLSAETSDSFLPYTEPETQLQKWMKNLKSNNHQYLGGTRVISTLSILARKSFTKLSYTSIYMSRKSYTIRLILGEIGAVSFLAWIPETQIIDVQENGDLFFPTVYHMNVCV